MVSGDSNFALKDKQLAMRVRVESMQGMAEDTGVYINRRICADNVRVDPASC